MSDAIKLHKGHFLYLVEQGDSLTLYVTPEGISEIYDFYLAKPEGISPLKRYYRKGTDYILYELLDDFLCNGYDMVNPDDIGALTDRFMFTDDLQTDDFGNVISCSRVFHHGNYQVENPIDSLLDDGFVEFQIQN